MFDTEWKTFLATQSVDNIKFSIVTEEPLELAYPLKEIKSLTFEDITNILKNSIYFFKLAYNKDGEILQVKLSKKP